MANSEHMRCAVCARHLARYESSDGSVQWMHHFDDPDVPEHEPVPLPAPEIDPDAVTVCDFCSEPGPSWVYYAGDFKVQMVGLDEADDPVKSVGWGSVGAWAACSRCHVDIEVGRWDKIAYRWKKEWRRRTGNALDADEMVKAAQVLWGEFRKNRIGEAQRLGA